MRLQTIKITNNTNLNQLIDEVTLSHLPISISSDHNNAVLVAEEDWLAIQETLFYHLCQR
jgi:PHD/YefM family antitoxin component YafN of YafNO toxin-antitoxin module